MPSKKRKTHVILKVVNQRLYDCEAALDYLMNSQDRLDEFLKNKWTPPVLIENEHRLLRKRAAKVNNLLSEILWRFDELKQRVIRHVSKTIKNVGFVVK